MPKRFTDSEKWSDKWYRTLPPAFKHAWNYMCDCCDHAGVFERDDELAEFRIGCPVDWDAFLKACGKRVQLLQQDKVFLVGFIEFQYGELSESCRAHRPVFVSIEKHGLKGYLKNEKGYSTGIQRGQDKDKDKDKDKDSNKKNIVCRSGDADDVWEVPDHLDCPEVRALLQEFEDMRARKRKPVRSRRTTSRVFRHFDDREHLIYALETVVSNEYQGLKPDYRPPAKDGSSSSTFAQQRVSNSQKAIKDFVNG